MGEVARQREESYQDWKAPESKPEARVVHVTEPLKEKLENQALEKMFESGWQTRDPSFIEKMVADGAVMIGQTHIAFARMPLHGKPGEWAYFVKNYTEKPAGTSGDIREEILPPEATDAQVLDVYEAKPIRQDLIDYTLYKKDLLSKELQNLDPVPKRRVEQKEELQNLRALKTNKGSREKRMTDKESDRLDKLEKFFGGDADLTPEEFRVYKILQEKDRLNKELQDPTDLQPHELHKLVQTKKGWQRDPNYTPTLKLPSDFEDIVGRPDFAETVATVKKQVKEYFGIKSQSEERSPAQSSALEKNQQADNSPLMDTGAGSPSAKRRARQRAEASPLVSANMPQPGENMKRFVSMETSDSMDAFRPGLKTPSEEEDAMLKAAYADLEADAPQEPNPMRKEATRAMEKGLRERATESAGVDVLNRTQEQKAVSIKPEIQSPRAEQTLLNGLSDDEIENWADIFDQGIDKNSSVYDVAKAAAHYKKEHGNPDTEDATDKIEDKQNGVAA